MLYFYPKDNTPGCTAEACAFRDGRDVLQEKGITIIGISKDSVASHKKFANHHDLNFTLLSDTTAETVKAYDSWHPKKLFGREFMGVSRDSYLIDPAGEIVKSYKSVNPLTHFQQILDDFQTLAS